MTDGPDGDEQERVLSALQQLTRRHSPRTDFPADEVAGAAEMDPVDAEIALEELVHAGRVESITAYWPDQGGEDLRPGGRLYRVLDEG